METKNLLRISQLARKAGVTHRTIRFYVQEKLITEPARVRKNMALYHPDTVFQIQAIKKAQTQRFMPLVVIRKTLEENQYDYEALEAPMENSVPESGPVIKEDDRFETLPNHILSAMEKRKWIAAKPQGEKKYPVSSTRLVRLFDILNRQGAQWEDLLNALDSIESLVKETMELEFRSFTGWALKNSASDFNNIQMLASNSLNEFMLETRKRHLSEIVCRHKKDMDYSFLASADEGFALPVEEIMPEIRAIEKKLVPRRPDIRILNDIAIGYSCVGDINSSLRFLRRVRRKAPEDLETRVRWIWYRRFSSSSKGSVRMKQQMKNLVEENPGFAMGRTFLGVWHMFDLLETDDPQDILRLVNLCLHELARADENMPKDLHQRTLIQYAKARILMDLPDAADHLSNSILSFENIIAQKTDLDDYYSRHLPFFPKWLWPNVYYFSGIAYQRANFLEQALEMFEKGRTYNVLPPFHDHIKARILQITSSS